MKKLFLLASLLMAFGISADAGDITSPNGQIKVNFTLDGTVPTYSVTYQGKTIIKPSRLGYQLAITAPDAFSEDEFLHVAQIAQIYTEVRLCMI